MLRKTAILLALTVALAPFTQAHGSPNPIEAEDLILDDEATDTTAGWDGFDIQTVHIREAYLTGEHGIVVRWTLWGGSSIDSDTYHTVQLFTDNAQTLFWGSADNGMTWTLNAGIGPNAEPETGADTDCTIRPFTAEVEHSQDAEGPADLPTWNVQFQAFVPHCITGLAVGESIDNAVATAWVGEADRVDEAPGGFYHSANPFVELQDPLDPDSTRLIDSLELDGPDRYTLSNITYADGTLSIAVENLISVSGQHIFAKTSLQPAGLADEHDEAGNHVAGGIEADAGEDVNFTIELDRDFGTAQVFVETDLGGQEVFWLQDDGTVTLDAPHNLTDPETAATPAVPVVLVAIAVAALAAVRRR